MKLRYVMVGIAFVAATMFGSVPARAQLRQVLDLNRQAMDAYTNLEIEQAMQLLLQAEQTARSGNVSGGPLARTYMNLGVVSIGGFGDNAQGLQYFTQALQADPNAQLDPLNSTPDINSVFTLARNRAGNAPPPPNNNGGGNNNPPPPPPPTQVGPGQIPHRPITEQLQNTALPIFVEAPENAAIGDVYVYFKAPGMRDFRRVEMRRMAGGFGLELPCADVMAPRVQYYIVAFDEDNTTPIGTAGDPETPFEVAIVSSRTLPPPALPGAPPPAQCSDEECPPGMECGGSGGSAGLGDTCLSSNDCRSGLSCEDNFCVASEHEDDDDDDGDSDRGGQPWFFGHVGMSLGLGYASPGSRADSVPDGVGDDSAYEDCLLDGGVPYQCNVRLQTPGFVLAPALRVTAGVWVLPRLAIAATFRFQFNAGEGSLANMLIGGRVQYQLTEPSADGLHADIHVGTSVGQIQLQPPQNGADEPYIISGLNGVQLGGTVGYRFVDNVGVFITPELHFLFPTFVFVLDITAGLEFAF